jgi:hypothetical protein
LFAVSSDAFQVSAVFRFVYKAQGENPGLLNPIAPAAGAKNIPTVLNFAPIPVSGQ